MNKINRSVASLALFGKLYNQGKDINDVIIHFIEDYIYKEKQYNFTLSEFANNFNKYYGFNIPTATLNTILRKLDRENDYIIREEKKHSYSIEHTLMNSNKTSEYEVEIENSYESILRELYDYVRMKNNVESLETESKENLKESLANYLINRNDPSNAYKYIALFFIENKEKIEVIEHLKVLRDGMILNCALRYDDGTEGMFSSWKDKLVIFCDVEIIFHIMGYNGEIFQTLMLELLEQIKDINHKKKYITLRYFEEVEDEINNFFYIAERIVRGDWKANPYKSDVMSAILKGCKQASDVVEKRTIFFEELKTKGIVLDTYKDYYSDYNQKYNILSSEEQESVSDFIQQKNNSESDSLKEKKEIRVVKSLTYLNYVAIRRGRKNNKRLEDVGYIFLTGNKDTLLIASQKLNSEGEVHLATDMAFLTSRFWTKINKGLGTSNLSNFDIIIKSQITLSSLINDSIQNKYKELEEKAKTTELSNEAILEQLSILREYKKKPEEITKKSIEEGCFDFFTDEDFDIEREGRAILKNENKELKAKIQVKDSILDEERQKNKRLESQLEIENNKKSINRLKHEVLKEKNKKANIEKLLNTQQKKDKRSALSVIWVLIILVIIITLILYFSKIVKDKGCLKLAILLLPYLILAATGKSFNPNENILIIRKMILEIFKKRNKEKYDKLGKELDIILNNIKTKERESDDLLEKNDQLSTGLE